MSSQTTSRVKTCLGSAGREPDVLTVLRKETDAVILIEAEL
jgi:hypothetical protein